jgi:hypothetical protein
MTCQVNREVDKIKHFINLKISESEKSITLSEVKTILNQFFYKKSKQYEPVPPKQSTNHSTFKICKIWGHAFIEKYYIWLDKWILGFDLLACVCKVKR